MQAAPESARRDAYHPWLLIALEEERTRGFELRRLQALERVEQKLGALLAKRPGVRLWLFGSLLQPGAFHPASDIDLAVEGLPPEQYFAFMSELEDCLETERLDLVELERCSFAPFIREQGRILRAA